MTKLSIAMATFNGGSYLEQQLRSFVDQTRHPDELVICDDGSTDGTVSELNGFARSAPFEVRIFENPERLGYNRNFGKAIERCEGDLIFISDQDDRWFPDKLETVTRLFEQHPTALAVTNDQIIADPSGESTGVTVLGNIRRLGYSDDLFGPGCCTALRRSSLAILAPFPGDLVPYDHWVNFIPALLEARVLEETPLQLYRRHDKNTSGSIFANARASIWTLASPAHRHGRQEAFQRHIVMVKTMRAQLLAKQQQLEELGLGGRLPGACKKLDSEILAYSARLSAIRRGRIRRLPLIIRLLRDDTYRHFQGVRSALKDLIS